MTEAAQLIEVLERNYRILLRQCDGLTHAESLLQPPFRGNCLNWVLGHLTQSRERLLKLFDLPSRWADDEVERYQRDSPPVLEDGPTVISLERMLQDFEAAHLHLHTRLEATDTVELGQPGKEIIEIVPSDDALLLEARVQPKDIAFLRPGQAALVKFTAYDFSTYGGLEATLDHIGADTITDEKGNAFYIVRVRTTNSTIGDARMPIIPGMVAEVDILTGKKSLLSYLMKPVLRAKANALTER